MNALEAIGKMWSIADKPERMRTFHKIVFDLGLDDGEVFWHEFWRIWETSESLSEDLQDIPNLFSDLIAHGLKIGDPHSAMEDDEKEVFAALPDEIVVYRGCISINRAGWSWTTDRDKAVWFAGRAFGAKKRLVMRGVVKKENVLAYLTGRGESEIVADPAHVKAKIEETFTSKDTGNALFYAVQSGRLNEIMGGSDTDRIRAAMMVKTIRGDVSGHIAQVEEVVEFSRWAGLTAKLGYFEAMLELLREKQADPNFEPLPGFSM